MKNVCAGINSGWARVAVSSAFLEHLFRRRSYFLRVQLAEHVDQQNIENVAGNLKSEIDSLYAVGARRFAIALLPEKIPAYSDVGIRLNPALRSIPTYEQARHPNMLLSISNWGLYFDFVLDHALQFGLTDTTNQCAGRAIFDEDPTPCASPASHFYYHQPSFGSRP